VGDSVHETCWHDFVNSPGVKWTDCEVVGSQPRKSMPRKRQRNGHMGQGPGDNM